MLQRIKNQTKFKLFLIAFAVIVIFILILSYPIFRCLWWILEHFNSKQWDFYFISIVVSIILSVVVLTCTIATMFIQSIKVRYLNYFGRDFTSFDLLLLPWIIICEFVFGFSSAAHEYAWIVCIVLIVIFAIYIIVGHLSGVFIMHKKNIYLKSPKIKQSLRMIQISDVHIGTRSQSFLDKVVSQVSEINGDIIFITGDLIDRKGALKQNVTNNEDSSVSDESQLQQNKYPIMQSLRKLTAKYGVYFVMV
ncbi:MAG: hypothetical protein EZS28_009320 [Streblomastix strix]|uniref:Calcineurin-like phosphoesterase domain-containing protein n=1 Tax=Streblomastix strix TaxID=222440 RepID=A0A5J4WJ93_9EUKA|nr:MAG: hypothetical protein EZS28_009320 [Streblomastix strix]